jgi:hypothetical protein
MNQREKILLGALGSVAGLFALWSGGVYLSNKYLAAQLQLTKIQGDLEKNRTIVRKGTRAAQQFAKWEQQSLPANTEKAQSLYQKWLLDLVQKHQIEEGNVTNMAARPVKGIYTQFTFKVKGRASLAQVTRLLHDFYSVDRLHRIRLMRLKPLDDSTDLDLDMQVEALSMAGAPDVNQLKDVPSQRLLHGTADEYVKAITERNIFGPPHKPPTVTTTAKKEYYNDAPVSFSIRGSDPEKRPISYTLDDTNIAEGLEFDPQTGDVKWKPSGNGEYELTVTATDAGVPPKSASTTVKFAVVDRPPPPDPKPPVEVKKFDDSKYTYLTAVLDVDGKPEAWLVVRTTGKTLKLLPGEKFTIGQLKGTIKEIHDQEIQIETSDGKRLLVSIGESLRDGLPLPMGDI